MSQDGDGAGTPTDPGDPTDGDDAIDPGDRSDAGNRTDAGNQTGTGNRTDGSVSAAIGPTTLGGWLGYVVAPVLFGTVVYWFVSDTTELEAVVFAAMMVGAVLAMDYFFDTIPE